MTVSVWKTPFDSTRGLDPTHPPHDHIHNNDLRSESKGHLNGYNSICGLPTMVNDLSSKKKAVEGLPKGGEIIDHVNVKRFLDARCFEKRPTAHPIFVDKSLLFSAFVLPLSVQMKNDLSRGDPKKMDALIFV